MPFLLFQRQKFHRDPFIMNSMDVEMFNEGQTLLPDSLHNGPK